MHLDDIDWTAALQAAANGLSDRLLADALSLSALFGDDYTEASSHIARARQTEPLNPVHSLRFVLLNLRFGQWDAALKLSASLQEELPGLALPLYLRGIAMLRQEEFKRAANIAQDLITAHPTYAPARFLQAEANLRTLGKGVRKVLVGLPKGSVHAPAWADFIIKLALSGSDEGAKLARQLAEDATVLPADSPARKLAGRFLQLCDMPLASLEAEVAVVAEGSRAEEVLLLVLHDRLQKEAAEKEAEPTAKKAEPSTNSQVEPSLARRANEKKAETSANSQIEPSLARRANEKKAETSANSQVEPSLARRANEKKAETSANSQVEPSLARRANGLSQVIDRYPERRTLRRLQVSWLTRRAIAEAGEAHYAAALSLVERCLAIEPHETTHYQNRAALFTLLRESEAYHDAWFALNRHQYRLALLGKMTAADALRLAKPHRLFAQQARRNVDNPSSSQAQEFGVFKETEQAQDGDRIKAVVVNQERVDDDADLLRQWLHHHRAELVFCHWSLGGDSFRFLLHPENARQAKARLDGLTLAVKSLPVLVPEEGRLLAERIIATWQARLPSLRASYAEFDDPEVWALQAQYLETLADLAVLCLTWQPDAHHPELLDEVLELVDSVSPFFDERVLYKVLKETAKHPSYPVRWLANFMEDTLGLERGRENHLTSQQRGRVMPALTCELLVSAAYRTYDAFRGGGDGVRQALNLAEKARKLNADSIAAQLAAARFLLLAGYYDECRSALALVQRLPRAREEQIAAQVDELKKTLDERKKADPGLKRDNVADDAVPAGPQGDRLAALEQEIEKFPASIQAYEEIVHMLAASGRFQEALDWSERAVAHCLGRDVQVRARGANLEILGLSELAGRDQSVVRLYLTGAHRPALDVLQAIPQTERTYPLAYLLGNCLLAVNRPEEAQQAFEWALQQCQRQLHRAVLRRLAADIDQPYLLVARRTIHDSLDTGAHENALRAAIDMIVHLSRPELGFLDLARIHLAAALARAGMNAEPLPRPATLEAGRWSSALTVAYAAGSDLERARRLVNLSLEAEPASAQQGEQLLQKITMLTEQVAIADALASSGELLRRGKFDEALTALDGVGNRAEPRVVRQRALLLLKLERLQEADELAESLRASPLPLAREFLASYPALAYRQRMNVACRLIREGADEKALEILQPAQASNETEKIELGYCRAFCRTMAGYRHRRQGRNAAATPAFAAAMEDIEPYVSAARATGHARLIELYETLDKELA